MAKAQAKISDADKLREARSFYAGLLMSREMFEVELRRLSEDYTPSARSEILDQTARNASDAGSFDPSMIRVIFSQLRPQKRSKTNDDYTGSLLALLEILSSRDPAARQELVSIVFQLISEALNQADAVVSEEQLISIASSWRSSKRTFIELLREFIDSKEDMRPLTKLWARMMAPALGLKSTNQMISPNEAREVVEIVCSIEKWKLSEELLLSIPRIASIGGEDALSRFAQSGLADAMEVEALPNPTTSNDVTPDPLLKADGPQLSASHSSLVKTITEVLARGNEELSAAKDELEKVKAKLEGVVNERQSLQREWNSAEQKYLRDLNGLKSDLNEVRLTLSHKEDELCIAKDRHKALEKELETVTHQAVTRSELGRQSDQATIEQVYGRPLSKVRSLLVSARERNPELKQLEAVEVQLDNCIRKIERHLDVDLGLRGSVVRGSSEVEQ